MKTVLRHILSLPVIVLAATLFLSCSDDKETDQPAVPELGVVQDEYPTSADGGEHTIRITAKNIAGWNFRAPDQWIECSRLESENILMVTVDPNESTDPRTAEITIYADGAEDVVVKINQDAGVPVIPDAQVIWDNNRRFFAKPLGPAALVNLVEARGEIEMVEFNHGVYVTCKNTETGGGSRATTYDYDAPIRLARDGAIN